MALPPLWGPEKLPSQAETVWGVQGGLSGLVLLGHCKQVDGLSLWPCPVSTGVPHSPATSLGPSLTTQGTPNAHLFLASGKSCCSPLRSLDLMRVFQRLPLCSSSLEQLLDELRPSKTEAKSGGCTLRYKATPLQGCREALEGTISPEPNTDLTAARPFCPSCGSPSLEDTGPATPHPTPPQGLGLPRDPLMSYGARRPRVPLIWLPQSQAPPPDPRPADRRYLPYIKGSVNGFKKHFSSFSNSLENTQYFEGVRHPPCLWLESVTPMTSLGERRLAGKAGARPWGPEPPREAPSLSEQQQRFGIQRELHRLHPSPRQLQPSPLGPASEPSLAGWHSSLFLGEKPGGFGEAQWTEHVHLSHLPPKIPV